MTGQLDFIVIRSRDVRLYTAIHKASVWTLLAGVFMPTLASAQAISRTDLVGSWNHISWRLDPGDPRAVGGWVATEIIYTLGGDSTLGIRERLNGVEDTIAGGWSKIYARWNLQVDTLLLRRKDGHTLEKLRVAGGGDRLLWAAPETGFACADTLRRVDVSKPLPPPPAPSAEPSTVDSSALVGKWIRKSAHYEKLVNRELTDTDTVVIQGDGAWKQAANVEGVVSSTGPGISTTYRVTRETHTYSWSWKLYPGDILWSGGTQGKITVKDKNLTWHMGCGQEDLVFTRVSP